MALSCQCGRLFTAVWLVECGAGEPRDDAVEWVQLLCASMMWVEYGPAASWSCSCWGHASDSRLGSQLHKSSTLRCRFAERSGTSVARYHRLINLSWSVYLECSAGALFVEVSLNDPQHSTDRRCRIHICVSCIRVFSPVSAWPAVNGASEGGTPIHQQLLSTLRFISVGVFICV